PPRPASAASRPERWPAPGRRAPREPGRGAARARAGSLLTPLFTQVLDQLLAHPLGGRLGGRLLGGPEAVIRPRELDQPYPRVLLGEAAGVVDGDRRILGAVQVQRVAHPELEAGLVMPREVLHGGEVAELAAQH